MAAKKRAEKASVTAKALRFAEHFAISGRVEESAVAAGYSKGSARVRAYALMQNPLIIDEIARLRSQVSEKATLELAQVVREVSAIAFADLRDFVEWGPKGIRIKDSATLDPVKGRAVVEVKQNREGVSIKLADKVKSLEQLMRMLGAFDPKRVGGENDPDRVPTSVTVDVVDASVPRADA